MIDEIPDSAREAAIAAFQTHDPAVAVLDCAFDSLIDQPSHTLRSHRMLRFSGYGQRVDITVSGRDVLSLAVLVLPQTRVHVQLLGTAGSAAADTDEHGRAELHGLRPGTMSLLLTSRGARDASVRTAWTRL